MIARLRHKIADWRYRFALWRMRRNWAKAERELGKAIMPALVKALKAIDDAKAKA